MRAAIDERLLPLLVDATDLRRAAGQALHYLWGSLVAGRGRDRGFGAAVRAAAPGMASALERVESRVRRAGSSSRDARLRALLAEVLGRLADDVAGGDRMLVPFVRTLETRLADLARLMRDDRRGRGALDADLARDLRTALGAVGRAPVRDLAARLREARDAALARE